MPLLKLLGVQLFDDGVLLTQPRFDLPDSPLRLGFCNLARPQCVHEYYAGDRKLLTYTVCSE